MNAAGVTSGTDRPRICVTLGRGTIEAGKTRASQLGMSYSCYIESLVVRDLGSEGKPTVLTIANPVKGSGKTTTAAYLAIALGRIGQKVLIVDFDAQADLTRLFFGLDFIDFEHCVYDTFVKYGADGSAVDISEIIRPTGFAHVDVAPMNWPQRVESEYFYFAGGEFQLSLCLESVHGRYDFIVIDGPTELGGLFDNAVAAQRAGNGRSCFLVPWRGTSTAWPCIERVMRRAQGTLEILSLPERPFMFLIDSDEIPPKLLGKGRFRAAMPKADRSLRGKFVIDEGAIPAWIPVAKEVAANREAPCEAARP